MVELGIVYTDGSDDRALEVDGLGGVASIGVRAVAVVAEIVERKPTVPT